MPEKVRSARGLKNSEAGTPKRVGSALREPVKIDGDSSGSERRTVISNSDRSKLVGLIIDRSESAEMANWISTSFNTALDAVPVKAIKGGAESNTSLHTSLRTLPSVRYAVRN